MTLAYDVIVAGIGGMGSAACWHLAQRGQRVLGLERFDIGHAMGSSHGMTRIIRLAYFEGPQYVPLVQRAHQLWRETGALAGTQLLHVTGSLDISTAGDDDQVRRSQASCLAHDIPHEILAADDIKRRFPAFHLPDDYIALWQRDGGFVASERAIYTHVGLAQSRGADIRANEPLVSWKPTADGGVSVTTAAGTYTAGRLILTSGAWIGEMAADVFPHVRTTKQCIGWFTVRRPELFRPDVFPVFIISAEEGAFYGFPLWEHPGFKLGGPHFSRIPIDPDNPDRTADPAQAESIRAFLARYLPDAAGRPMTLKGCIYTVTPDEDFIIDHLPGHPQVVLASACSGHGFKFASAIGETLADLAMTGRSRFDLSAFSLSRFQKAA